MRLLLYLQKNLCALMLFMILFTTRVHGGLIDALLHGAELNGYGESLVHHREHVTYHQHHEPPVVPAFVPPPPPQPPAPVHHGHDYYY